MLFLFFLAFQLLPLPMIVSNFILQFNAWIFHFIFFYLFTFLIFSYFK